MSIIADDSVARFIRFIRPNAVSAWTAEDGEKRNERERKDGYVFLYFSDLCCWCLFPRLCQ